YWDPGADTLLRPEDIPLDAISAAGMLHVGSLSLTFDPARAATLHAVREAKARGVFVSYDPNWRPALWPNPSQGIAEIASIYPYCDCIKVNREELSLLVGTTDVIKGADFFHHQGIRLVLVTLDAEGCYYSCVGADGGRFDGHVPGYAVTPVDTTGAGDAFMGAMLVKIAAMRTPWTPSAVHEWAEFAVAASALVTTRRGAIPALPTGSEVEAFMRRGE
ncbi:MAG: hypothetical protein K6T83_23350, partial [Alicyclobacillus sp.]|nr:hypothetical protein [Alicyclobacillus sp.]